MALSPPRPVFFALTSSSLALLNHCFRAQVLVGLDGAGKSTLLQTIRGVEPSSTMPTFGFEREVMKMADFDTEIYDLGGGKRIRGKVAQVDISLTPCVESTLVFQRFNCLKAHPFQAVGFKHQLAPPPTPRHMEGLHGGRARVHLRGGVVQA